MSEDEAKTKVCPQKLAGDNHFNHKCEASACMAWRVPRMLVTEEGFGHPNVEREGFCGLAGAPQ